MSRVGATGSGVCSPAATRFPAGTVSAVAVYGGAPGLAPSASGTIKLTVAKATSRTSLALTAARIDYGHEQTERLTVTISPRYAGTPGGNADFSSSVSAAKTLTAVQ